MQELQLGGRGWKHMDAGNVTTVIQQWSRIQDHGEDDGDLGFDAGLHECIVADTEDQVGRGGLDGGRKSPGGVDIRVVAENQPAVAGVTDAFESFADHFVGDEGHGLDNEYVACG